MNKCPCKECIILAMCRHKSYRTLVIECSLLEKFLYGKKGNYFHGVINERYLEFVKRQNITSSIMKSKKWGPHYEVPV